MTAYSKFNHHEFIWVNSCFTIVYKKCDTCAAAPDAAYQQRKGSNEYVFSAALAIRSWIFDFWVRTSDYYPSELMGLLSYHHQSHSKWLVQGHVRLAPNEKEQSGTRICLDIVFYYCLARRSKSTVQRFQFETKSYTYCYFILQTIRGNELFIWGTSIVDCFFSIHKRLFLFCDKENPWTCFISCCRFQVLGNLTKIELCSDAKI